MLSTILARADALMHRRRANTENDDIPVLIDAIDPDSDIPVLLDIDLPVAAPAAQLEPKALPEPAVDDEMLDDIARELARRVHERLTAELPKIVETTIRDFLDEPEMRELLRRRD